MSFSDRIGITKPKSVLQIETMDDELRNGLWQACSESYFNNQDGDYEYDARFRTIMGRVYVDFFKRTSDVIPYGYTSDQGGIRHALLEESNIDEAEAKFMMVACSAFVNFCVQRSA